jgi:hypothetical protein
MLRNAVKFGIKAAVLAIAIGAVGCTDDPVATSKAGTFIGQEKDLDGGMARSWVSTDADGNPTSVGVTFSENVFAQFSDTSTKTFDFSLPTQGAAVAFDHVTIDWNPRGHEPSHVYDVPHFDFHFYTITRAQRQAITATGDDTNKINLRSDSTYYPGGYFFPGGGVPTMGAHWLDTAAHEIHGHPFDKTFLYGYYDGKMSFMEPMITAAYLRTKTNITENITVPQKYHKSGYYPTKYSIKYDDTKKEYTIAMEGLTKR